eukprot:TRINITY_DN930_c0_g1_i1.p1 TRINITY_DN930_c0_g1~~TRINITY_DN930_c0_g1_i1.p1  ORF type:complete len:669 (-),score=103.82 TRINITY_DN930_c0_g1_i1:9387-11321(-)
MDNIKTEILAWFQTLSPENRQLLLTDTWPEFIQALRKIISLGDSMHIWCSFKSNPLIEQTAHHYNKKLNDKDAIELLSQIRLFEYGSDLDSFIISYKLARDPALILRFIEKQSNSKCFTKCTWINKAASFEQFPSWFLETQPSTLCQWIAGYMEFLITKRFYQLKSTPIESLVNQQVSVILGQREKANYWANLSLERKTEISQQFLENKKKVMAKDADTLKRYIASWSTIGDPFTFIDGLIFLNLKAVEHYEVCAVFDKIVHDNMIYDKLLYEIPAAKEKERENIVTENKEGIGKIGLFEEVKDELTIVYNTGKNTKKRKKKKKKKKKKKVVVEQITQQDESPPRLPEWEELKEEEKMIQIATESLISMTVSKFCKDFTPEMVSDNEELLEEDKGYKDIEEKLNALLLTQKKAPVPVEKPIPEPEKLQPPKPYKKKPKPVPEKKDPEESKKEAESLKKAMNNNVKHQVTFNVMAATTEYAKLKEMAKQKYAEITGVALKKPKSRKKKAKNKAKLLPSEEPKKEITEKEKKEVAQCVNDMLDKVFYVQAPLTEEPLDPCFWQWLYYNYQPKPEFIRKLNQEINTFVKATEEYVSRTKSACDTLVKNVQAIARQLFPGSFSLSPTILNRKVNSSRNVWLNGYRTGT